MYKPLIGSVILAAGESVRMGFPKALLPLGRDTFLGTILARHADTGLDPLLILGNDYSLIQRQMKKAIGPLRVLRNLSPEQGPLSSLKLGLPHLLDLPAVIVHPVDHPSVTADTLGKLLSAHQDRPECIILPRFQGRGGHPVLFPRRLYTDLEDAPLSEGARFVVRAHRTSVLYVEVDDPGIHINVDTPERYVELFGYPGLTSPEAGAPAVEKTLHLFRKLQNELRR